MANTDIGKMEVISEKSGDRLKDNNIELHDAVCNYLKVTKE
jgi:hypothetical protein